MMERIWFDRRYLLFRWLLIPASLLFSLGSILFRKVYDWGMKTAQSPHPKVVCVGNLSVGGSGKTPVTIAIAQGLMARGNTVIVGASGYGSGAESGAQLAPSGELNPADWGDEPAVLRRHLPGIPLIVGRDRVMAAKLAFELDPNSVLVMDDGFQHLRLAKKVSVVIDPPCENGFCLPAGPFREDRSALRYATIVLGGKYRITYNRTASEAIPEHYSLVTAIANPERFLATSEEMAGTRPKVTILRPDHDPLTEGNLLAEISKGASILTTEKDWVKLSRREDASQYHWVVIRQTATIEPESEFFAWLTTQLES